MPTNRAREFLVKSGWKPENPQYIDLVALQMDEFAASEVSTATKELDKWRRMFYEVEEFICQCNINRSGNPNWKDEWTHVCGVHLQHPEWAKDEEELFGLAERAEAAESLVLESQLQLVDANRRLAEAIAAKRDEAMRCFQLTERVRVLGDALRKLANEASGFRCTADINRHGATNMRVLGDRITSAFDLLSALSQVPAELDDKLEAPPRQHGTIAVTLRQVPAEDKQMNGLAERASRNVQAEIDQYRQQHNMVEGQDGIWSPSEVERECDRARAAAEDKQ